MRNYDYIIVGSGLAGLYTAYRASAYGKVALLTKSNIRESNSYFAQGGIKQSPEKMTPRYFTFKTRSRQEEVYVTTLR